MSNGAKGSFPSGVGATSLMVAHWRAEENHEAEPLFSDPHAALFHAPGISEQAELTRKKHPIVKTGMRYRTRFFDDAIHEFVSRKGRQIVLLGSGLDLRPVRLTLPGVHYFEVDQSGVLDYKSEILQSNGVRYESTRVSGSYLAPEVWEKLAAQGLKASESTLFLWEGNAFYLPIEECRSLFAKLHSTFPRAELLFDCFSNAAIAQRSSSNALNELVAEFARLGAPWVTGAESVIEAAVNSGFEVTGTSTIYQTAQGLGQGKDLQAALLDEYQLVAMRSSR